jgi:hypothetical protein
MKISYEYEYGDEVYFVVADRVFRGCINRVGDDSCLCGTNFIISKTLHREVGVLYTYELPDTVRPLVYNFDWRNGNAYADWEARRFYFKVAKEDIFLSKHEALEKAHKNLMSATKVDNDLKDLLKFALTNFVPSDTIEGKSFREKCERIGVK